MEPELVEDAGLAVDVDASSVLGLEERLDLGESVGLEERNGNSQSSAKDWRSKGRSGLKKTDLGQRGNNSDLGEPGVGRESSVNLNGSSEVRHNLGVLVVVRVA